MKYFDGIENYIADLKGVLDKVDRNEINRFLNILYEAYDREANVFIFGNGGSALTASHIACDLNKGVSFGRKKRFKVFPLTDNIATIMAYANDLNYEDIFVEQLKNFFKEGDVAIGISGSGNSKNVLKAIEYANKAGGTTIGISGFKNGRLKEICDCPVSANIDDMQIAEDMHVILGHIAMKAFIAVLSADEKK